LGFGAVLGLEAAFLAGFFWGMYIILLLGRLAY
jgi:hypothetical protein